MSVASPRRSARRAITVAIVAALAATLSACAPDPVSQDYLNGTNAGYIAVDGFKYVPIPADERGEPVAFSGTNEYGEHFDSKDALGKVVVVNFWYAACGPCRVEAPELEAAWQKHEQDDVVFIGINIRDEAETARAFASTFGVTYPSIIDARGGEAKLAFTSIVPVHTPPTTVVLDTQGRAAARLIGAIRDGDILSSILRDVLAENA